MTFSSAQFFRTFQIGPYPMSKIIVAAVPASDLAFTLSPTEFAVNHTRYSYTIQKDREVLFEGHDFYTPRGTRSPQHEFAEFLLTAEASDFNPATRQHLAENREALNAY